MTMKKTTKKTSVKKSVNMKVEFYEGELFEIEIFVAKKCANLSELYEKIYALLSNPKSKINGFSLYAVEGDWRSRIEISKENQKDFETLKALKSKHGKGAFKDLIRPIISKGDDKFVIFDEASVVIKIIIQTTDQIDWDDSNNILMQEIKQIFSEITKNENSIFFTVKELKKVGSLSREKSG